MSKRTYKFVVERDTNMLVPRYTYLIYAKEEGGSEWIPVVDSEPHMKLSKKKAIAMARSDIADMQALDKYSTIVHEEVVPNED